MLSGQVPDKFTSKLVMEQLTCSGVFEAGTGTEETRTSEALNQPRLTAQNLDSEP